MELSYHGFLGLYFTCVISGLLVYYFAAFGGSWSHRNTAVGRLHRKLCSVFDFPVVKLIPPFLFYGGFLYVVFMFFSFLYRQMRFWSKQVWWVQHISAWVTPGPLLSFVVLFLVGPKYSADGTYCKQCKCCVEALHKYSYLTMTPICKKNAFWYFLFVFFSFIASAFFIWPILVLSGYVIHSQIDHIHFVGEFIPDMVLCLVAFWNMEPAYVVQMFVLAGFTLYFFVELVDVIVFMIRGPSKRKEE